MMIRLRRLRLIDPRWKRSDAGPLVAIHHATGSHQWWRFAWGRYQNPSEISDDGPDIAMPYPRAEAGALSLAKWTAPWQMAMTGGARCRATVREALGRLVWFVPALMLLVPGSALIPVWIGLALSSLLLLVSGALAQLVMMRDEAVRVHGRFWDRMIDLPIRQGTQTATQQGTAFNAGLGVAIATAARRRHLLVESSVAATGFGLALTLDPALAGTMAMPAALGFCIAAGLKARQDRADLAFGKSAAALRFERGWSVGHMPGLRGLRADGKQLDHLAAMTEDSQRAEAVGRLARIDGHLAIGWTMIFTAAALVATWSAGWAEAAPRNLVAICLLAIPITHAVNALGEIFGSRRGHAEALADVPDLTTWEKGALPPGEGLSVTSLTLKDIGFAYPGMPKIFGDIAFSLQRGDVVALSGPSGGGKSTLMRIAMGLLSPTEGQVVVNDLPMPTSMVPLYRGRIAAVFQDQDLGFATIMRAILQDAPAAGLPEAMAAVEAVGLGPVVARLPMGMQTLIVAGAFPFGLTRQVLIARCLVQKPDILVLDETLSPLDYDLAASIVAAARRQGAAVLFSSHRPELLRLADRTVTLGFEGL